MNNFISNTGTDRRAETIRLPCGQLPIYTPSETKEFSRLLHRFQLQTLTWQSSLVQQLQDSYTHIARLAIKRDVKGTWVVKHGIGIIVGLCYGCEQFYNFKLTKEQVQRGTRITKEHLTKFTFFNGKLENGEVPADALWPPISE